MAGEKEFTTAPEPRPDMAPQRGPGDLPFSTPEEGTFIPKIPGSGPASPTRRKRGLLDLKTDLKSLKYSQFGAGPLVTKDINNPPRYNSASNQVTRRADDLVRITKFLASGNGVKFLAKQGLLSQIGLNRGSTTKEKLLQGLKNGAINAAKVAGSTLAQVPVSGTGVHFIRGFTVDKYLKTAANGSGLNGFLNTVRNVVGNQDKTESILDNGGDNYSVGKYIDDQPGSLNSRVNTSSSGRLVNSDLSPLKKDLPSKATSADSDKEKGNTEIVNFLDRPNTRTNLKQRPQNRDYSPGGEDRLQVRAKMGNPGGREVRSDVTKRDPNTVDEVNESENFVTLDIIPFEIEVISPDARTDKRYSTNNYIYFRAHLDSFSDDFTGNWNETKYVGRAEPMYTYDGFNRSVSFAFKIAAFTRSELLPLYRKLNFLASSTAPTYNGTGAFMRGTFSRLTIGDYLSKTPGFFNKIGISWEVGYPWEINLEDDKELPKVPHILNVDCGFTPVHNFIPALNQPFLMKDTFYANG